MNKGSDMLKHYGHLLDCFVPTSIKGGRAEPSSSAFFIELIEKYELAGPRNALLNEGYVIFSRSKRCSFRLTSGENKYNPPFNHVIVPRFVWHTALKERLGEIEQVGLLPSNSFIKQSGRRCRNTEGRLFVSLLDLDWKILLAKESGRQPGDYTLLRVDLLGVEKLDACMGADNTGARGMFLENFSRIRSECIDVM